ncbi:MAG: ATP-binding cassette domain-containing protein, partial [Candidatus Stygibacter australis]|nr:ATP-binding cassette domain-containing protein [Candidatus Stygibacter australis]
MQPIVEAKSLEKIYKTPAEDVHALKGLDFSLQEGDFTALMGHSGAGKTTLLNLIGCLDKSTKGQLFLDGKQLELLKDRELTKF